jgi:isopenicillin-N N-acyltransferase-like protein
MYHWKGSPFELGVQHGKDLREHVEELWKSWRGFWVQRSGVDAVEEAIRDELPRYEELFRSTAPEVLDEMKGIAEGSGLPYRDVLCLNILEEIRTPVPDAAPRGAQSGCTQIAVTGAVTESGRLLIGKNEDGGGWDGRQYAHARIEPEKGHRFITAVQPGRVGAYIGFSETGLSYSQSSAGVPGDVGRGWPRLMLFRLMMERCSTVDDARDFIGAHNFASAGINLMLADQNGRLVLIEKTHRHSAERYAEDGILIGVNVFQSDGMRPSWDRANIPNIKDSVLRIDRILRMLEPERGKIRDDTLKAILSDHENGENSICSHGGWRPTGSSYIYDPQSLTIQIAEGRPCQHAYVTHAP